MASDIRKISQKHFLLPILKNKIKNIGINQLKQIQENLNDCNQVNNSISENTKKPSEAPILRTSIQKVGK